MLRVYAYQVDVTVGPCHIAVSKVMNSVKQNLNNFEGILAERMYNQNGLHLLILH